MSERVGMLTGERIIERLRVIREAKKMSQEDVAIGAGMTANQVSQVERGKRGLDLFEFLAWCRSLHVDLRDVVSDERLPVAWV